MGLLLGFAIALVLVWAASTLFLILRRGLTLHQAAVYTPIKLLYRVVDGQAHALRNAPAPVIYAISHHSRLDPAIMLSLLPPETLHILDERSARSPRLEPWRELARTIAFNAEHVFVSRRLVRHLKGKGRLAVYFPENVEPDTKTFRLYRAVARIALKADAKIVPVVIGGARHTGFSLLPQAIAPRRRLPRLEVFSLPALSLRELAEQSGAGTTTSNALFDRMAEARLLAQGIDKTLFAAVRDAANRYGAGRIIVEDALGTSLTYRKLMQSAQALACRLEAMAAPGEAIGVLLPSAAGAAVTLLALNSAARPAVMINYSAGTGNVASAIRMTELRHVISSRAFVEKAGLQEVVTAVEAAGAKLSWLEELREGVTAAEKLRAALSWRRPLAPGNPDSPAVILFTSGSEGTPKGVVLSNRNIVANALQVEARIAVSPADTLLNVLPVFHSFGLTGGTVLPLLAGVRVFLYPSPLHARIIPDVAAKLRPTIMVGTDTFLANYARAAKDTDFASLRLVVAGAEPVRPETRALWLERFGTEIHEGFGMTEAAPVVAVNTATHSRPGTVGRLLPGIQARLEPVEGIPEGGRLLISGPNLMLGTMSAERPGEIQLPGSRWHDTGDIVSIDREGFVTIRGREKRFAKIAGEMVSLGAVEMLVAALWPQDRHAVVAVPDKRRGERIVLVTTAEAAERAALQRFGKKSGVSGLALPDAVVRIAELPLLATGKTDYRSVQAIALERLGLSAKAA